EGPSQSDIVGFLCGNRSGAFRKCRIPTTRLPERNRKDRAIAVNHVEAEQHWNLQSRLVHRHALHLVRTLRAASAKGRAEQSFADQLEVLRTKVAVAFAVELLQLAQFFFERHLHEQGVDALFDVAWSLASGDRIN